MKKQNTKKVKLQEVNAADIANHVGENLQLAAEHQLDRAQNAAGDAANHAIENKLDQADAAVRAKITAELAAPLEDAKEAQAALEAKANEIKKAQEETQKAMNEGMAEARLVGDVLGVEMPDKVNVGEAVANGVLGESVPTPEDIKNAGLNMLPQPAGLGDLTGGSTPSKLLSGDPKTKADLAQSATGVLSSLGGGLLSFLPCCKKKEPQVQPNDESNKETLNANKKS
jgi:hypothetical protein